MTVDFDAPETVTSSKNLYIVHLFDDSRYYGVALARLDKRQIFAGYRKYAAFYLKSDFFVRKIQNTFMPLDCRANFPENGYDGRREFHIFDFQRFFDFIQKHTKEYAKINADILFKKEKPPLRWFVAIKIFQISFSLFI